MLFRAHLSAAVSIRHTPTHTYTLQDIHYFTLVCTPSHTHSFINQLMRLAHYGKRFILPALYLTRKQSTSYLHYTTVKGFSFHLTTGIVVVSHQRRMSVLCWVHGLSKGMLWNRSLSFCSTAHPKVQEELMMISPSYRVQHVQNKELSYESWQDIALGNYFSDLFLSLCSRLPCHYSFVSLVSWPRMLQQHGSSPAPILNTTTLLSICWLAWWADLETWGHVVGAE